jgi:hypothetical protein
MQITATKPRVGVHDDPRRKRRDRTAKRAALYALGCIEMQGYLFSPARPTAEIRAPLSKANRIAAA